MPTRRWSIGNGRRTFGLAVSHRAQSGLRLAAPLRQARAVRALEDDGDAFIDPGPAPDAVLETRQRYRLLEAALARLPPEHREILLLREIEDMPHQDIATVPGLNVGTVKSRIARARTALLEKTPHRPEVPK